MFSPLNDPQVEHWFQRLNAPLKRLPAGERAEVHQEVRQHLEALAEANEELGSSPSEALELALQQFGDPSKFGRHMAWEWKRKQGIVSLDMAAVLYGISRHAGLALGLMALCILKYVLDRGGIEIAGGSALLPYGYLVGVPTLTGWAIGRKYPSQALRSTLHTAFVLPILPTLIGLTAAISQGMCYVLLVSLVSCLAMFSAWLLLACVAAYLASVTKRGWYKPTLNGFKLTLPKRRRQVE